MQVFTFNEYLLIPFLQTKYCGKADNKEAVRCGRAGAYSFRVPESGIISLSAGIQ